MFENSPRTVFIGFSGGKDSLVTALLLAKLGYLVHDLVIDMGTSLYDLSELREKSFNKGVKREIISVRNPAILNFLTNQEREDVLWRLNFLESLPKDSNSGCTHCYFVKMYVLYAVAKSRQGSSVVLGHHKDDMICSLLKCYWIDIYYKKFTKPHGIPYDGARMLGFMEERKEIDLAYLRDLVDNKLAATDEPFVEDETLPNGIKIYRPLGEVSVRDIVAYLETVGLRAAREACVFKNNWTATTRSFRLIVREDYHKRLSQKPELENELFKLALLELSDKGTWLFRPRNTRDRNYPGFKPFIKKL